MCNLCAQGLGVVVQVDSKEESRQKGQLWEQENGGLACPHVAHPPNPGMEERKGGSRDDVRVTRPKDPCLPSGFTGH